MSGKYRALNEVQDSSKDRGALHRSVSRHTLILMRFAYVVSSLFLCTLRTAHRFACTILDISQHSHEIGHANLPFTRRGRKAAAQRDKKKGPEEDSSTPAPTSSNANAVAGPSSTAQAQPYSSAIAMLAPLPSQTTYQPPPQPYGYPSSVAQPYPSPPPHAALSHDRWENMATLFHSVREHARGFEYPAVSVAALETILIRLYLESPVGVGPQPTMTSIMQNGMAHPAPTPPQPSANQSIQQPNNGSANSSASGSGVNSATGVDE